MPKPDINHHHYALLVFALAAMGFGLRQLLMLNTMLADTFAAVCMFLAIAVTISALVHYWRYG
jgi:hypothetical protein